MNLKKLVGEHTIDVDLLPEAPLVLDVGCRRFNFCEEILKLRPKARIIAVDPGPDILDPCHPQITYLQWAVMETNQSWVWLSMEGCSSVISLTEKRDFVRVPKFSFRWLLEAYGPYFDLIKFDCEGAEFGILKNWPGKCATQINIEFHDNMVSPDGKGLPQSYFDELFHVKLSDYRVIQNEPDSLGIHADALLVATSHV